MVFFSGSYHHLHLQVIFISISVPSLGLDHHHWIWIITQYGSSQGHHHWICIITRSRSSSLGLDHHSIWIISGASSLDLDHPSIWIISTRSSTLNLHRCYLMILLITGSSTKPPLFHAGCRPSLHLGLLQCLYLTLSNNGSPSTYIWPWEEHIQ